MNELELQNLLTQIKPVDRQAQHMCQLQWNQIGKPLGSLGKLETIFCRIAGIQRSVCPTIKKRALIVMCADHGVVEEGVTQTGQEVTAIVAENFFDRKTCTSIMCEQVGCDLMVVDIGMAVDTPRTIQKKVAYGTKNMAKEPAMTREQAVDAIAVGIEFAKNCRENDFHMLLTGEMGIGNTTASSAVASCLLNEPVERMTGRGAGLSNQGLETKIRVIKSALNLHKPNPDDPIDVLSKVGGLDLAGMCGVFLGGAIYGLPVLIDGVISAVAALLAARICPPAKEYMIATHVSKEPAAQLVLDALGQKAGLTMDMCLGEGSGAVAFLPLLDLGETIYLEMGTFDDIHVEAYQTFEE